MEVKLPALLEIMTDRPIDHPTDQQANQPTSRRKYGLLGKLHFQ